MDFFHMLEQRRSVRRFDGTKVSREHLDRILKAALSAPSSKNCKSSSFIVVEDSAVLEKISSMRDFGSSFLKYAPAAILVMGDESTTDLWLDNAAISATYIQLSAEALGLGSCWVHVNGRPRLKDDPSAGTAEDYLRGFLPIPESHRILCAVAIGRPENADRPKRDDPDPANRIIRIE